MTTSKEWKPEYAEEYEAFMNEQFKILMEHASRCFLRCKNKEVQLKEEFERGLKK